jgi:hypothetical protein
MASKNGPTGETGAFIYVRPASTNSQTTNGLPSVVPLAKPPVAIPVANPRATMTAAEKTAVIRAAATTRVIEPRVNGSGQTGPTGDYGAGTVSWVSNIQRYVEGDGTPERVGSTSYLFTPSTIEFASDAIITYEQFDLLNTGFYFSCILPNVDSMPGNAFFRVGGGRVAWAYLFTVGGLNLMQFATDNQGAIGDAFVYTPGDVFYQYSDGINITFVVNSTTPKRVVVPISSATDFAYDFAFVGFAYIIRYSGSPIRVDGIYAYPSGMAGSSSGGGGGTGPTGSQGSQGEPGPTGPTGRTGSTGSTGSTGYTGYTGTQGYQGAPGGGGGGGGDTGPQGSQGSLGSQGPQGILGVQGVKGDEGSPGLASNTGAFGDGTFTWAPSTSITPLSSSSIQFAQQTTLADYITSIEKYAEFDGGLSISFQIPGTQTTAVVGYSQIPGAGASNINFSFSFAPKPTGIYWGISARGNLLCGAPSGPHNPLSIYKIVFNNQIVYWFIDSVLKFSYDTRGTEVGTGGCSASRNRSTRRDMTEYSSSRCAGLSAYYLQISALNQSNYGSTYRPIITNIHFEPIYTGPTGPVGTTLLSNSGPTGIDTVSPTKPLVVYTSSVLADATANGILLLGTTEFTTTVANSVVVGTIGRANGTADFGMNPQLFTNLANATTFTSDGSGITFATNSGSLNNLNTSLVSRTIPSLNTGESLAISYIDMNIVPLQTYTYVFLTQGNNAYNIRQGYFSAVKLS